MEPELLKELPDGGHYLYQVKWDGIRLLSYVSQGQVRLFTKSGRERTGFYPELDVLPHMLAFDMAVVDGEALVLDEKQKPSFYRVMQRELGRPAVAKNFQNKYPVKYVAFDLLFCQGRDLRAKPLEERDSILRQSLRANSAFTVTDNFRDGASLLGIMAERGWEGIVAKDPASPYLPGKGHHRWFKVKVEREMLLVAGGILWKNGQPVSLLLGAYDKQGSLHYLGRVKVGDSIREIAGITEIAHQLASTSSPLAGTTAGSRDITWLEPRLTVVVRFLELSEDGGLRHPRLVGFSNRPAGEATLEQ